jgi:hypothetical protein
MNVRSAIGTVLVCLTATVVAVASLDRVCTWLVDDAGSTTRAAIMLANAPLFGAGSFMPAATEPLPGSANPGRASRRASTRTTTHDGPGR